GRFHGGDLLVLELGGQFGHAQVVQIGSAHEIFLPCAYSMTLGTRNRPSPWAGALRILASRWLGSLATSSRRRSTTSWMAATGWASGSTPEVSTACIFSTMPKKPLSCESMRALSSGE